MITVTNYQLYQLITLYYIILYYTNVWICQLMHALFGSVSVVRRA